MKAAQAPMVPMITYFGFGTYVKNVVMPPRHTYELAKPLETKELPLKLTDPTPENRLLTVINKEEAQRKVLWRILSKAIEQPINLLHPFESGIFYDYYVRPNVDKADGERAAFRLIYDLNESGSFDDSACRACYQPFLSFARVRRHLYVVHGKLTCEIIERLICRLIADALNQIWSRVRLCDVPAQELAAPFFPLEYIYFSSEDILFNPSLIHRDEDFKPYITPLMHTTSQREIVLEWMQTNFDRGWRRSLFNPSHPLNVVLPDDGIASHFVSHTTLTLVDLVRLQKDRTISSVQMRRCLEATGTITNLCKDGFEECLSEWQKPLTNMKDGDDTLAIEQNLCTYYMDYILLFGSV